ncbi:MAG: hypothetical protein FWF53_06800 [Candidatus Azobacteroides sp.]|nr:hypothetical protein [Candidatus Azobacteroides sp.]
MPENQNDVIFNIEVKYEEAVKGIAEYTMKIEENRKIQESLKKALRSGIISQEEYNKSMAAAKAETDYNKKAVQALSKEIQNNLKIEREKAGSLNALRAALSDANAKYAAMSEEQRKNSDDGKKLKKDITEITAKLKEEEEALGDHRRSVGDYEKATRNLRGELAEYVKQIQEMKLAGQDNTAEFQELIDKAGEIRNAINSANQSLRNMSSSQQAFNGINQGLQTLIGSYGLYQSVLGLSDTENKKLADTMKNLQIVMAALNSLTAIQNALKKESAMMTMLQTTQTKIWDASTKSATATMKLFGVSTTTTSTAFKLLRGAIIGTGIGALVVLVGELIAHWDDLVGWFKKGTDGMSGFGKAVDKIKEVAAGVYEAIKNYIIAPFAALGKIMSGDFNGALDEMKKGLNVFGNYQKGAAEQTVKNQENAAKRRLEAERKAQSEALLNEAERLENTLAVDRASGKSAEDLYKKEMDILNKKTVGYRLALQNISDVNSDEYKNLKKTLDDLEQDGKVKEAAETKRLSDVAEQRAQEAAQAAKERAEKEREAIRQAEDAALAIVEEGADKQRRAINLQYERQIEDLQRRLADEENLTDTARGEINKTIIDIETKRQQDLDKLSDEEIKKRIENETKLIELQLQSAAKGGEEEYKLRMQQLEKQQEAELRNTELTEEMKAAIIAKYDTQRDDLAKQRQAKILADQKAAIDLEWRQRLDGVIKGSIEESNIRLQQAQSEYDALLNMDAESKAARFGTGLEAEIAYTNAVLDQKERVNQAELDNQQVIHDSVVAQLQAAQTIGEAFSQVLESFAEDNETLAVFAKTVALFNIGLATATALVEGVRSAQKVGFPANIPAIAITIAAILANVAKAKQLLSKEKQPKAPKFAEGGVISGAGSGTSDGVTANLSRGESVMTASATSMFGPALSALNQIGGGVPINVVQTSQQQIGEDMLFRAFARAIAEMPNPVVSVEEINNVNNRVQVQERLSNESI